MEQQAITVLLNKVKAGEKHLLDDVYTQLYSEIKAIAMNQISQLNVGETITPTVMANECYIKLVKQNNIDISDKKHFLSYLAKSMRMLLLDILKAKSTIKRQHITSEYNLTLIEGTDSIDFDFMEIERLLKKVEEINVEYCQLLEYKLIFSLTFKEISEIVNKSQRHIMRIWKQAITLVMALSKEIRVNEPNRQNTANLD